NVNQAASNGFIKFKIKQAKNLPDGTEIKNSADIYFDYNDPVITNKTLHTINRNLTQPNWDGKRTIATTACLSYTFNSVEYTKSGSYIHRITNTPKDSLITLNLTINNVLPNADVTQNNTELSANLSGANYQWIDCNNNTPIASQNSQIFEATVNGSYSVKVTKDACATTSSCYAITTVAVTETNISNSILIYPNPSTGNINIDKADGFENCSIKITSIAGALVLEKNKLEGNKISVDLSKEANGIYFIQLIDKNATSNFKIVKN
ncbi:MAG: T9SS type A sorting domain-containing protein, partial [Bacteroidia bacterium]|nr:T9SS type A sorting domain-containing protein [Bacteroidia bacterium]